MTMRNYDRGLPFSTQQLCAAVVFLCIYLVVVGHTLATIGFWASLFVAAYCCLFVGMDALAAPARKDNQGFQFSIQQLGITVLVLCIYFAGIGRFRGNFGHRVVPILFIYTFLFGTPLVGAALLFAGKRKLGIATAVAGLLAFRAVFA